MEKIRQVDQGGKNFSGTVKILKEPEIQGRNQKIIVANEKNKFLIKTYSYPEYFYGDELRVNCALEIPKIKNADENNTFDYQMYLAKDGIFYLCQKGKIEKIDENQGNKIYALILKIKNKLKDNIKKIMPAPELGLLIGLLLGGNKELPQEIQDNFSTTGMTHIVAVSGYNVTIVAEYLMLAGIFLGLWRRQAFYFALGGIFFFIILVGLPSSAVRAGIMGGLLLWAMKNGRMSNAKNAILFSAVLMLLINPLLLRWDIGFQLSFLATLGIVALFPFLEKKLIKENKALGIWEILLLTISAQAFVLPVILYNFGNLSLISPSANLLILPLTPITMLLGFLAVMLEFLFHPLALVFAWLTFLPLKFQIDVINFLASLSWASVKIENFSWVSVVIWYLLLFGFLAIMKKRNEK